MIDTHTHLYLENFDTDRETMMQRALDAGVTHVVLPDIESNTTKALLEMCHKFPAMCLPLMGVHPCSIKDNYKDELSKAEGHLYGGKTMFYGVGEIGLDYYWDKTYITQQHDALRQQLRWAKQLKIPVSLHTRDATDDTIRIVSEEQDGNLIGVFHCFGDDAERAKKVIDLGFYLGIGGVATYKKSTLPGLLKEIGISHVVLETDAPFLPPAPHRGGRNESAYLSIIASSIADTIEMDVQEVKRITTDNARKVFNIV